MESNNLIPKYVQIAELILLAIKTLNEGTKLSSEHELCSQFDVSRSTVRQAIGLLVKRGYLEPKQGIGNIITIPKMREYKEEHLSFTREMDSKGLKHKTIITSVETITDAHLADIFKLPHDTEFVALSRDRFINNKLAIVEVSNIQKTLLLNLDEQNIQECGLYAELDKTGITLAMSIEEKLKPVILNDEQLSKFSCEGPTAMMSVERIASNSNGIFEYTLAITNPNILEFTRNLTRG